jgi:hypothetical protein
MQSIKSEAKRNAELATDIDNFRSRYTEISYGGTLDVTFPAGDIESLDKNLFRLLAGSELVIFKPSWYQRPDYVSFEYYNTTIFWIIILYVNRIASIEDFVDLDKIYIPPFNLIIDIMKDRVPESQIADLTTEQNVSEARYYKVYPLNDREKNIIKAGERLST